jgi:hypothetical protein
MHPMPPVRVFPDPRGNKKRSIDPSGVSEAGLHEEIVYD